MRTSSSRLLSLLLLLLLLLPLPLLLEGCASSPDANTPMARDMTEKPPGVGETTGEEARFGGVEARTGRWKDETEGDSATLVYVTEVRGQRGNKPGAMIFSSDPQSAHFKRRPSATFIVRRLYRAEMTWLKADLRKRGFFDLPWVSEANYDQNIGPARGFHYYEGGQRTYVIKDELGGAAKRTFRQVEDRLLELTYLRKQ